MCAESTEVESWNEADALREPDKFLAETYKKAEEGDVLALLNMGDAYTRGFFGLPQSDAIAVQYYLKAAELGAKEADEYTRYSVGRNTASRLSTAYRTGRGVPQSDATAEKWESLAKKFRQALQDMEDAKHQQRIKEHEAMIPQ